MYLPSAERYRIRVGDPVAAEEEVAEQRQCKQISTVQIHAHRKKLFYQG